jgi:hypothetical protein
MPRKRPGYTQLPVEMPDELVAAVRVAAERHGEKVTVWVCRTCAKAAGVSYAPARPGRPPKATPPKKPRRKPG